MSPDDLAQAIAGLVAVVSLAMIAIAVGMLRHSWHRFEQHRRKLSWATWKATGSLGLFILVLPTGLLFLWALFSTQHQDLPSLIVSRVLTIILVVLVGLFAMRSNGVRLRRRTKAHILVPAEYHTLWHFAALCYLALSIILNAFALVGVSHTMLLIEIAAAYANFEFARWLLMLAVYAFLVGIVLLGTAFAIDKATQWKNELPKDNPT